MNYQIKCKYIINSELLFYTALLYVRNKNQFKVMSEPAIHILSKKSDNSRDESLRELHI